MVYLILFCLLAVSCATAPKEEPVPPPEPTPTGKVDLLALERFLGLNRSKGDLGYDERTFNTCQAGYGYSSSQDCRAMVFVAINFQLQCRDSDGTTSTVEYQTRPVEAEQVKWNLGNDQQGFTRTDSEGYGQIRAALPYSPRSKRLRLTVKGSFISLTAEDIRRVVAPDSWCRGHR